MLLEVRSWHSKQLCLKLKKQEIGDKFQGDEERNMPQHVWSLSIQKLGSLKALAIEP